MELIYLLIFLISCLIEDIDNVLLKKTDINVFKDDKILHVSEEPSLLQCAQRCRFLDKNSIVDFKNSKCTCVKYEVAEGKEQQGTLTGVFVNQKIRKAKKMKHAQSTKPPQSTKPAWRVINVALNKIADQSATQGAGYDANNAIDGLESTRSYTKKGPNQFWSVDLNTTIDIMYMVLKGDYNNPAHKNFWHFKSYPVHNRGLIVETRQEENGAWKTCKNIGFLQAKPFQFTCDNPTNARFVMIRSTASNDRVAIEEFEVYANVTM